jgi:uncharacterized membrane protein YeiH
MAFAVTGAIKAVEHKLDIFGVIVLAAIIGLAGGIIRDVVLGKIPPSGISEISYVSITIVTAIAVFFLYHRIKSQMLIALSLGPCFRRYFCDPFLKLCYRNAVDQVIK